MSMFSKFKAMKAERSEADTEAIKAAKAATPEHIRRSFAGDDRPYLCYDAKNGEAVVWVCNSYDYRAALRQIGAEFDANVRGWKLPASRIPDISAIIPAN